jgi:hypothetical protein
MNHEHQDEWDKDQTDTILSSISRPPYRRFAFGTHDGFEEVLTAKVRPEVGVM